MLYSEYQQKEATLHKLYEVKEDLQRFYPMMDLTDFEMAIYSLEDDLEEDDGQ